MLLDIFYEKKWLGFLPEQDENLRNLYYKVKKDWTQEAGKFNYVQVTATSIRYTGSILEQLWIIRLIGTYFNKSFSK